MSPSARYTFWWQQHSLRRSMLDSLPSHSLETAAKMLNQMAIAESQSFESLRDRCSRGDAASAVTTGAKEGRRWGNLQCEKSEDVRVTRESWRRSYISMYALGGATQKSVRFPNTTKIISYPTMLPPPSWLRAAGPPPQARHLTGRIDRRHNFGDPATATVEWQRGDISQG